jgi:hypothetical protein
MGGIFVIIRTFAALLTTFGMAGAAMAAPFTVTYHPKSIVELRGQVEVADFAYVPANPKDKPNKIPNSALGSIKLPVPIGTFLADGLRQELRASGVSLAAGARCRFTGRVESIKIDDLGFGAHFRLAAEYVLTGADGRELYRTRQSTDFGASKFGGAPASISLLFSNNINAAIGSSAFMTAFEPNCPRQGI